MVMANETIRLAEYAASLRYEDLPPHVVQRAKDCIIDTVAVIVLGNGLPWSQIISRYAPPPKLAPGDHNPTDAYIAFVADWVGVTADEPIDVTQPPVLFALVGGIIHFEQGADCCSAAQIQQGVTEALESFKIT